MPAVQWFPGHMAAAKKKVAAALKNVDLVLEILDSRCPKASQNPMIRELLQFRQKPVLKLLNKCDLADPVQNKAWSDFLNSQPKTRALLINAHQKKDIARALKAAQEMAPHRGTALKPLRLMVLGIPNVGKSTFLNGVAGKKAAATGDVPAVTKAVSRIDVSPALILLDTPGLMWNKIECERAGLTLAATNAIGINAFDAWEVALFLADFLKTHYPQNLKNRYDFSPADSPADSASPENILLKIAQKRSARLKGSDYDLEKSAHILLTDFRSGALGKISLEKLEI